MPTEDVRHRPLMELAISGLNDGEHPFQFDVPAQKIGLDESFLGNVRTEGVIRKVAHQLFLTGTVHAGFHKECDRCLAEIRRDVSIPLEYFYREVMPGERSKADEEGDSDIRLIDPDQETIVLDDEVRQTILLEIPLKMLCQEACKGLCPRCGADLNNEDCQCPEPEIDPRWEKLSGLFKREESSEE